MNTHHPLTCSLGGDLVDAVGPALLLAHLAGDGLLGVPGLGGPLLVRPLLVEHLVARPAPARLPAHARDPLVDVAAVRSLLGLREGFLLGRGVLVVDDQPLHHLNGCIIL